MAKADGYILVDTHIDTKSAKRQLLSWQKTLTDNQNKMAKSLDKMRKLEEKSVPTKKYKDLKELYDSVKISVDNLNDSLKGLKDNQSDRVQRWTDRIKASRKEIERLREELNKPAELREDGVEKQLEDEQKRLKIYEESRQLAMSKSGNPTADMYKSQIAEYEQQLKSIESRMEALRKSGEAFEVDAKNSEEWKREAANVEAYKQKVQEAANEIGKLKSKELEATKEAEQLGEQGKKSAEKIAPKVDKAARSTDNARRSTKSWLGSFSNGSKRATGFLHTFASRLKGIALSMFIFNWITKGWNAMLSAIKDGTQNMAKYSTNVNAKMSQLTSAVATLKNAFGVLSGPIITAVGPALTMLINMLTAAINKVNQFISALTGKKTWTKATTQVKDYAAGLDKAANSAKKLKGQLQSFDELNNLSSNDSGGSGGSGSGGNVSDMFEDVPIDQNIADLAEEIKKAIESGDWEGLGELVGNKIKSALDNIDWDKVYVGAITFGSGLALFLNGLISPELFGDLGRTIAGALNTALHFLDSFGTTFDWENLGDSIAQGINTFFSTFDWQLAADTFNTLAHGIITAASEAISETDWTEIGQDIGTLLAGIDWIGLLSDVGKMIWDAIKAAIETWKGMFDKAPIETALLTVFALLKLTGVGSIVTGKIAEAVGGFLKSKGLSLGKIAFGLGMAGTTVFLSDSDNDVASIIGAPITAFLSAYSFTGKANLSLKIGAVVLAANFGLKIGNAIGDAIAKATLPEEMQKYRVEFKWSDLFSYSADDWKQGFKDWKDDTWGPAFDQFIEDVKGLGSKIIDGLTAGFSEKVDNVKNLAKDLWDGLVGAIKDIFGIHSPAKKMKPYGRNIFLGIIEGWKEKIASFSFSKYAKELFAKIKKGFSGLKDDYVEFKAKVKDEAKEWWQNTQDYWSKKVGSVKDFTTNVKDNASIWWKNTQIWWKSKVGKAKEFTTDVKNQSGTWWRNAKSYWNDKVGEVKKFTTDVKKDGKKWWKNVMNEWSNTTAGKTLTVAIGFAKNALNNLWSSVTGFFGGKTVSVGTKTTKKANGGIYTGGMWHNITKYALGTENAPAGQVFIAREAGPELVGTIGGHTSVVNNDQIVASVSDGVARAVRSVIGTNGSNVNVTFKVEGDPNGIFRVTQQKANEYFRTTGNPAFEM